MFVKSIINFAIISIALAFFPSDHYRNIYNDDFPADYDPDTPDLLSHEDRKMTFDGIHDRRKKFNVETPMDFPSDVKPEAEELNDDHLHSSDDDDYNEGLQDSQPQEGNGNLPLHYASESQTSSSFLSDGCLRCLCEASSDCNPQVRCHVEGPNVLVCGPYQIDMKYWKEAGSPGLDQDNPMDYEDCMNDIDCSIDTVNAYMKKWAKDCDGDGRITCDDYAKIHKAGSRDCNSTWVIDTPFWSTYKECFFD